MIGALEERGVVPFYLFPNMSSATQPLDIGVNKDFKVYGKNRVLQDQIEYFQTHNRSLEGYKKPTREKVAKWTMEGLAKIERSGNVPNAFRRPGFTRARVNEYMQKVKEAEANRRTAQDVPRVVHSSDWDIEPADSSEEENGLAGAYDYSSGDEPGDEPEDSGADDDDDGGNSDDKSDDYESDDKSDDE